MDRLSDYYKKWLAKWRSRGFEFEHEPGREHTITISRGGQILGKTRAIFLSHAVGQAFTLCRQNWD